ncbi:MAG: hypothetical protein WAZ12_04000 [Candidatus Absconditicoccaceae bacterium]
MKIFSSFDTRLRQKSLKEHQDQYGVDKVVLLDKSWLFLFEKVFPKLLGSIIIMIVTIVVSNWVFGTSQEKYTIYVIIGMIFVLLTFAGPVIKHFIDYYMDFALVTPKSLIMFNQTGIFKRDMATVDVDKIKTISVRKRYFLYSVFNNGDLIFLSEGDSDNFGEITLYFIPRPEEKKEMISNIIGYEV